MKIGILQTGRSPEELRGKHGDYDDFFKKLLAGRGLEFTTYPVLDGVLPSEVHTEEGWLVTGSKFAVYEDHDWIPPLEDFLREIYAAAVPVVGICFGHQIIAQALGGKVEKHVGGWSVGSTEYRTNSSSGCDRLFAWHQDQVVKLPKDAKVVGSSKCCRYAMLTYGPRALTIQPHPEFTSTFFRDLLEARRISLPTEVVVSALSRTRPRLSSGKTADRIEAFFKNACN